MKSHAYPLENIVVKETIYDEVVATVALADAEKIDIAGAKSISIQIIGGGTFNNRSGALTIYLSNDGSNFTAFNMLVDNVTNTNGQDKTRVASKTVNSATSAIVVLDSEMIGAFTYMKLPLTITDSAAPTGNFTVLVNKLY